MTNIKEIFTGQLKDALSKRASNRLLNTQQQKEINRESAISDNILAGQKQQLKKRNNNPRKNFITKLNDNVSAKEKSNLIVGQ